MLTLIRACAKKSSSPPEGRGCAKSARSMLPCPHPAGTVMRPPSPALAGEGKAADRLAWVRAWRAIKCSLVHFSHNLGI